MDVAPRSKRIGRHSLALCPGHAARIGRRFLCLTPLFSQDAVYTSITRQTERAVTLSTWD